MDEELRLTFAQARKARASGDFTTKQINIYIRAKTEGAAKDMASLASLVGQQSEAVTVAETPNVIPRPLRPLAAGLQQFGQGVTLGGGDELSGLASQFAEGLRPGSTPESRREARQAGTAESREGLEQFRQEHPVLAPALQIAGGIGTGAAVAAPLLAGAGSASVLGTALRGAGVAGAEGGIGGALSGETPRERAVGAAVGTGLGSVLGGAAGTALAAGGRVLQRFRLSGAGSPTARTAVTNVRTAIDGALPATNTPVSALPGIVNRARASTPAGEFKLAQLDLFGDLADDAGKAIRGRLGLGQVSGEALSAAEEAASSAPMLAVQPEIAGGRMVSTIARRIFGSAEKAEQRALTNELNRILQSTDPDVIDKFVQQLLRAEPVLNTPLGTRFPLAPAAAAGGAAPGLVNPLLDR